MNKTKVNSHNEWDPLNEVIVGVASNAKYPKNDLGMNASIAFEKTTLPYTGVNKIPAIPKSVIDETNEDLEILVNELQKLDVRVRRPAQINTEIEVKTPYWKTSQYFNYCPRDTLLIVGDIIFESPNTYRSRYFETFSYRDILSDYLESGCKWISAPKPRLRDEDYDLTPGVRTILNNTDPMFDAAAIIRAGRDIFYLVSNSGNELGLIWLQNILGSEYRLHPLRGLYSGTHIDTTLAFLRPGLLLANPARVNGTNLPEVLKEWEIVYTPEMEEYSYSCMAPLSSKWLGMNLFMINPSLAVVDSHQEGLIKTLDQHKIDVLPLKLRHGRQLEGGFHCVTLDVYRTGEKEDYFT
jgi:N-dimethylarginine dimethylaminohydrolase